MKLSPLAAAVAACALAFPVSIAAGNIALGLLGAALAHRALSEHRRVWAAWRAEPAVWVLLAYAAAGLVSAGLCDSPAEAARSAWKDWHRPLALLLFVGAISLEPAAPVFEAFALSFASLALWGCSQSILQSGSGALTRAHGFVHPVVFGEMMALAALGGLCVTLRPGERHAGSPGRTWGFTALALLALLLSQTRMAVLAAAAGFALVAVLEPKARRWSLPAGGLFVAVAALWELTAPEGRAIRSFLGFGDNPRGFGRERWSLWGAAWRMFRDHPATGVGPGGYRRFFPAYHPGSLDNEAQWGSAHNQYLHVLAERGALGATALAALYGTLWVRAVWVARRRSDARSLWAASAATALLLMSLTETAFQSEQFASIFLLVWAWGVAPPGGVEHPEKAGV